MTKTSDAIASLIEALKTHASTIDKLIDADTADRAKLDEAHAEIDNLKAQLDNTVDDDATSQSIEQLTQTLKEVAAKALAATPASTIS